jgi:Holliday junction DNA helicase RuvA
MIDFLRGQVAFVGDGFVVLDVGGVGYRVFCPNPLEFQRRAGEEAVITVYVHYHVREDAHLLYGFSSREEQALFRRLLEVSGVGPKVALGVLAASDPPALVAAIRREDAGFLTRLPGVGRKTAQRIILDLKDKLAGLDEWSGSGGAEALRGAAPAPASTVPDAWAEAREALMALGYRDHELDRAWSAIKEHVADDETTEALMKRALRELYSG